MRDMQWQEIKNRARQRKNEKNQERKEKKWEREKYRQRKKENEQSNREMVIKKFKTKKNSHPPPSLIISS